MTLLTQQFKEQLNTWLGDKKTYNLLFKATRDGCSSQVFHRMCDNKGPTVTVVRNTDEFVFGGYTAVNWTSDNQYGHDATAFLFRFQNENGFRPKKYPVRQAEYAIHCNGSNGPVFGGGPDFDPLSGNVFGTRKRRQVQNKQRCRRMTYVQPAGINGFEVDDSYGFQGELIDGNTYHLQGNDRNTFTNIDIEDIEVHQITSVSVALEGPWRRVPEVSQKTLLGSIESYSPPSGSKVKAINLLLLGPVGAGKSSFFNTVNSIFQGEITSLARSGSAERSLTTTYRRYRVQSGNTGKPLNLRFCDTRGLENESGLDLVDLLAVVEGHIPDRYQFSLTSPITPESTGYNSHPTPDDKIHCVAFVIDGTAVDVFPEKVLQIIKSFQQRLNPKGIPQVIIVTKVDRACSEVHKDVGQIFNSATIQDLVDKGGQLLGLTGSCVFPVKNYDREIDVDDRVNLPVLLCLKKIIRYADDYILDSLSSD